MWDKFIWLKYYMLSFYLFSKFQTYEPLLEIVYLVLLYTYITVYTRVRRGQLPILTLWLLIMKNSYVYWIAIGLINIEHACLLGALRAPTNAVITSLTLPAISPATFGCRVRPWNKSWSWILNACMMLYIGSDGIHWWLTMYVYEVFLVRFILIFS